MAENDEKPDWIVYLRHDLAALPADYEASYAEIVKCRHQFFREISQALEGRLNAHLHTLPRETLAEKRNIATMVNRDLRELNLCVRCPHTGSPAILVADFSGHSDGTSRFRYEMVSETGRRLKKLASRDVPTLELQEAPQRIENLADRRKSSGRE